MRRATLPVTSRVGEPDPCATGVPSGRRSWTFVLEIVAASIGAEKVIVGWTVTGTEVAPAAGVVATTVGPSGTVTSTTLRAVACEAKVRSVLVTSTATAPRTASGAIAISARIWLQETSVVERTVIFGSEKLTLTPAPKFAPLTVTVRDDPRSTDAGLTCVIAVEGWP